MKGCKHLIVKKGQLYKRMPQNGDPPVFLEVIGVKKDNRFLTRILTDRPGVYAGSHSMSKVSLYKYWELVEDK